jgi:hypothetical protein
MMILAGISSVAAILSAASYQTEPQESLSDRIRWANPNVFSARAVPKEFFLSPGFYYGDYRGRKSEIKEVTLGASFNDRLTAWYSHQDILLKGRASTSRYRNESDIFGVRWLLQEAGAKSYGLAVELETVRPTAALVRTSNSSAEYPAPTINRFKAIATDRKGLDAQFAYTRIDGVGPEEANLFDFGVGKDLVVSERWTLRLQGHLIGQNLRNTLEEKTLEIKPVAYAALAYKLGPNAHLETDLTFMPSGTPLAFGRLTSLTAFQIYQPGGVAAGIRKDTFGVGAIRLLWRAKF